MEVDTEDNFRKRKRPVEDVDEEYFSTAAITFDEHLLREVSKHPKVKGRAHAIFKLLNAYDLLRNFRILKSVPASYEELCNFHSSDYIQYLKDINNSFTPEDEVDLEYGLGYDCPPLDNIYDYCCIIGGSTITAAKALVFGTANIAVNWCGGWHHAQRDEAEGFCYVNDIALGILELRQAFENVLYFDLDIHHGNGVENCFAYTKRVMTVSLHLLEAGFYPGTGTESEVGYGTGRFYAVNAPLKCGTSDATYIDMFDWLLSAVLNKFKPDAIVVQCGADGLTGDPVGQNFNLTLKAYGHCLKELLKLHKPTLILGGGGYNIANTARCWTYLSSIIVDVPLSNDIPEHDNFGLYGPTFELPISSSNRRDMNSKEYIAQLKEKIVANLQNID